MLHKVTGSKVHFCCLLFLHCQTHLLNLACLLAAVRQLDLPPDQEVKVADGLCSNAFQVLVKCLNASRRHASRAEQQLSMPFVDLRAVLQNRNSSSSTTNNCTQSAGTQIGWDLFVSSTSEHVKSGSNRGAHMACISRMRDTEDNMKWTD